MKDPKLAALFSACGSGALVCVCLGLVLGLRWVILLSFLFVVGQVVLILRDARVL